MNEVQNVRNKIINIILENELPREITKELQSIYEEYEEASRKCCSSLIRIGQSEKGIVSVVQYIKRDTKDAEGFIDTIARK